MNFIHLNILILLFSGILIALVNEKIKGYLTIVSILIQVFISSVPAIKALTGIPTLMQLNGSFVTGEISLVIDPISAWFILIINFTFITSAVYGSSYMSEYKNRKAHLSLHWISFLLTYEGLIAICIIQNTIAFLIAWEIMTLGAFFLVIFEGHKTEVIRAGIYYLIQSHIAMIILTIAFIWIAVKQGSYSFEAIKSFAGSEKPLTVFLLMILLFIGFGTKAGFVPFHTWLPHAHPAAPSHVSGMMSGVLIKIGIYGIIRMIFLLNINYLATGYLILTISVITGIYGVMLAIVQHNMKRLLAYHSIENIGIIGIGIGLGCIGIGQNNALLSSLGFTGALLHTLNHSLFKSLLFYSAGNLYQSTHTMNIEKFGGIMKQMPHTAFLFLIAALAICGLPPFNGFISEFTIYNGLFQGFQENHFPYIILLVFAIFGLSLIGGLAILCFTKAFGLVFLGNPRYQFKQIPEEKSRIRLIPMYLIVSLIILIGIFPQPFIHLLTLPVNQLTGITELPGITKFTENTETMSHIGIYSSGFILLTILLLVVRRWFVFRHEKSYSPTWGCGYVAPDNKMQYTASSFVRNYTKLARPLLLMKKTEREVKELFPRKAGYQSKPKDKAEEYLVLWPLKELRFFMGHFSFLQNGRLQFYILYGLVFITLLIGIPFVIYLFKLLILFLNTL